MSVVAVFNKLSKSEKSALIMIKTNAFQFGSTPVYAPTTAVCEALDIDVSKLEKGMKFSIPSGFELIDIIGEDGDIRTTKDGIHLKQLSYSL